tara:strand:- start:2314 stop:2820 length:507 start_codon:yes stop_codon:yes gene_type:complete
LKTLIKRNADQFDTIQNMRKYAIIGAKDPFFQKFIKQNNIKGDIEGVKKIAHYIFKNIAFEKDVQNNQIIRYGTRALRDGYGNCVDYSVLLSQFFINLGIPHSFKMVATESNTPENYNHIYVTLDNYRLPIDLVIGQDQDGNEDLKKKRTMYLFKEVPYFNSYKLKVI